MQPESTLNQLKAALPKGQLPANYGVYFKNTIVALCHALEDHILQNDPGDEAARPLVLVTFQQGKWYLQEADRYLELAEVSQQIVIAAVPNSGFADHPTSQRDNVALVNLDPADCLTQEWNLLILAPHYAAMLLCHELAPEDYRRDDRPMEDGERKFYGLWTFERSLVETAAGILIERFRPYAGALCDRLQECLVALKVNPSLVPADLSGVITRIVTYLQGSQQQLITVSRQTRELAELEGQALRLNRNLAANKLQAFLRMAQRVDERDPNNPIASLQVAALAETLGQILDVPTLTLRRLRLAGLLFRIGLAEAPSEVFTQANYQLDERCGAFWNDRALLSAQLLGVMPELAAVTRIVRHHLEWWDGSGRPDGLKGEHIPLESRILGLVAYFQALTRPRGDRPASDLGTTLAQCRTLSGTRFDPSLVDSLATVVRLTEIGLMQLPERPSQMPTVWLEDTSLSPSAQEATP